MLQSSTSPQVIVLRQALETDVRKHIQNYLLSTRIENWRTLDLVDTIAQTYRIQNATTSQSIISKAYIAELGNYCANHGSELSKSAKKRLEVFCKTATAFMKLDHVKEKLTRLEREVRLFHLSYKQELINLLYNRVLSMPVMKW